MVGVRQAEQPADDSLVAAAQSGSARAFDLLVVRHHAAILRYLARQTGDPELAADLAQETFLDAFRSLDRLGDDRSFAVWLHRIAHHNLLAARRRQRLRRLVSLDWLLARDDEAPTALHEPDRFASSHERDLIQRALDDLSPALREALLLSSVQGFKGQEVAQILGIAPAAAHRRIGRAKEQFRQRYRALEGAGDDQHV